MRESISFSNESISFSKLPDGTWGVRVATQGKYPEPGSQVTVTKKDGSTEFVGLGEVVYRDIGAGVFPGPDIYYRIANRVVTTDERRAAAARVIEKIKKHKPMTRPIAARYSGKCLICKGTITPGDMIIKDAQGKFCHASCVTREHPPANSLPTSVHEQTIFVHGHGDLPIEEAERLFTQLAKEHEEEGEQS